MTGTRLVITLGVAALIAACSSSNDRAPSVRTGATSPEAAARGYDLALWRSDLAAANELIAHKRRGCPKTESTASQLSLANPTKRVSAKVSRVGRTWRVRLFSSDTSSSQPFTVVSDGGRYFVC